MGPVLAVHVGAGAVGVCIGRRRIVTALELARAEREDRSPRSSRRCRRSSGRPRPCVSVGMSARSPRMPSASTNSLAASWCAVSEGRLLVDRINQMGVDDYADRTPEQLIELIREYAEPHGLTAGFGGRIALTDNMIHQQDIRRALGIPRTIPAERLRTALDFSRTRRPSEVPGAPAACVWSPPTSTGRTARAPRCKALARRC